MRHLAARREALGLVEAHDGDAKEMVEERLDRSLADGDMIDAVHLDQVRREIEDVYEALGDA